MVKRMDVAARPGYNTCKAHEYEDEPGVLAAKVKLLASLIRRAKHAVVYTGAGLSTSSGIGDYATKGTTHKGPVAKRFSPLEAKPTLSHRVLVALHAAGELTHWIQQNHDGLPQKAGMPQGAINEIHGAWCVVLRVHVCLPLGMNCLAVLVLLLVGLIRLIRW
jgi:hypothetical protein